MAIIKCKCCGGDINLSADKTYGVCDYCGSTMTLPKIDDDQRAAAFNRGNHFRRQGEFDKALAVYERIVAEDDTDAEAHWCCAICRFGIEYVEDPATYEWLPTCHRVSFDSFLEDVDYLAAVEHSDGITKRQYQKDAAKISEVQRGILATSQNEEPFDVFICYKESEENGERTRDSILAQEIYYQLTEQGRRVFFSRITLEDKAGTEYEPYIFAALNSSKVMVVVGTTPEHFSTVWVKNEWSRFLALMRKDRKKLLLPCYRDMDPYDLPEQLSVLQSYDMAKIGFMQDLTRGINKVLDAEKKPETQPEKQTVVVQQANAGGTTAAAQVQRGNMALEDHDWNKADSFFEEALNLNPQCAEAYIGKLLARDRKPGLASWVQLQKDKYQNAAVESVLACGEHTAHITKMSEENVLEGYLDAKTIEQEYAFDRSYQSELSCRKFQKTKQLAELKADRLLLRAQQYAFGDTKEALENGLAEIQAVLDQRIANAQAQDSARIAELEKAYAAHLQKADEQVKQLRAAAENRREQQYQAAVERKNAAKDAAAFRQAEWAFEELKEYKDSKLLSEKCRKEAERLTAADNKAASQKKKHRTIAALIAGVAVILCAAAAVVATKVIIPNNRYNAAAALMDSGNYEEAIPAFEALAGYKDSDEQIAKCEELIQNAELQEQYDAAVAMMDAKDYDSAITAFAELGDFSDSQEQITECNNLITEGKYQAAKALMDDGKYEEAIDAFTALGDYSDSANQIELCHQTLNEQNYNAAVSAYNSGDLSAAYEKFAALGDYCDSADYAERILTQQLQHALVGVEVGDTVSFGRYEQDNSESNGTEAISWRVLEKENDRILVISETVLFSSAYDEEDSTNVKWSNCYLREYLNSTFMNDAFTSAEAAAIMTTAIENENDSITEDSLFLLNRSEAESYFLTDDDRVTTWSHYAKGQCSFDSYGLQGWRLRGNAETAPMSCVEPVVTYAGEISRKSVIDTVGGIRPAMWIRIGD